MGKLIVLDGLDGSGKSTQLDRLDEYLTKMGTNYQRICFPDYEQASSALVKMYLSGEFGTSPEDVNAYAASSFYAVDRFASYKRFWKKAYESDTLIVAARYTTSNAIHQMPKLPQTEWNEYLLWLAHYEYELLGLPRPDCVLFLDMPPEISQKLMTRRYDGDEAKKDIHERNIAYLNHCREAALYAAENQGWKVVSCSENGEPLSEQTITEQLIGFVKDVISHD